ncbi:MAG TPA: peptidyl-alpha-hydroxyglycine alpha-amidating lyase family protein [Vicinamibacterales bacterium]|nr:peptidyl-alpha-hydroxyglycine alpha-amidating lyase family protein [Vicinamibacterales bacterium]
MKSRALALFLVLACTPAFAQRPSDPALLVPQQAPPLDYVPVPDAFHVPDGTTMGAPAAVAFEKNGRLLVLTRGKQAFFEFEPDGRFVRTFGEGLFTRAHGLRIDRDGNIWATDVGGHTVMKFAPDGTLLMTLGTKGEAGAWDEATGSHRLNQPNDVAIGDNGDIFVAEGHLPQGGDPRVLKFDRTGKFLMTWGGKGTEPGKFAVAHSIAIGPGNLLWVADRENQRIQVFDQDGHFVRQMKYAGLPCSLDIGRDAVFMTNGFAAQVLRLDLDGKVLAAMGKPGKGPGEFGEAHMIAVGPDRALYVADSVNATLQKFVPK